MNIFPIYLRRLNERKTGMFGGDHEIKGKVSQIVKWEMDGYQ